MLEKKGKEWLSFFIDFIEVHLIYNIVLFLLHSKVVQFYIYTHTHIYTYYMCIYIYVFLNSFPLSFITRYQI